MRELLFEVAARLFRLGGLGLLIMGVLDSSILFAPLGNDLLLIALAAKQNERVVYYVAMAACGSVLGTWVLEALARKGGAAGVKRFGSQRRLEAVKRRFEKRAGWVLAFTALIPPPFPYKIFIAAAAALQYSRRKLLLITAGARVVRFGLEGMAAVYFGPGIVRLAESPAVQYAVGGLVLLSIGGSVLSVYRWVR